MTNVKEMGLGLVMLLHVASDDGAANVIFYY
jgi:hypothetical protein